MPSEEVERIEEVVEENGSNLQESSQDSAQEEVEVKVEQGSGEESQDETSGKATVSKDGEAILNIYSSFNNTLVHVTDMTGQRITKVTGGMVTKHDRLKANPTIAMFISKRITEEVKNLGVKSFFVRIRAKTGNPGPGPGAHSLIKSLTREGFKIINILDYTRIPRGGPKKKRGRRGRRP